MISINDGREPSVDVPVATSLRHRQGFPFRRTPADSDRVPLSADRQRPVSIYRAVFINNLAPSTTLTDVLEAIAKAGPFGMVLSAKLSHSHDGKHGASIEFNRESAAVALIALARRGEFYINGARPYVKQNNRLVFNDEHFRLTSSRVLRLTGDPDVKGFNEKDMRAILLQSPDAVKHVKTSSSGNCWGFDSEPAKESLAADGSGRKIIDWPFFSNVHQAMPFMIYLRKHFGSQLQIDFGDDPCGPPGRKPVSALSTGTTKRPTSSEDRRRNAVAEQRWRS